MPAAAKGDLDGYVATREVEELTTYSRRWLYHLIKINKFPKPDIPGRIGSAHKWRRSTIKRALEEMAAEA